MGKQTTRFALQKGCCCLSRSASRPIETAFLQFPGCGPQFLPQGSQMPTTILSFLSIWAPLPRFVPSLREDGLLNRNSACPGS